MARSLFGGRVGDTVASLYNLGNRQVFTLPVDANGDPSSVTLQVWDAVDGVQLTDLLAADGTTPITVVTVPSTGQVPEFYGPDGVNVAVYVKDPDDDFYRLDARADDAAQTAADAAAAAEAAATAAEAVGNTNDTIIAGRINDPASATASALSASIEAGVQAALVDFTDGFVQVSGPDVIAPGDSLTAGAGGSGTTWPSAFNDILGSAYSDAPLVTNLGVGGETSATIAGRVGSTPWLATVAGGSIPASGSVVVTLTASDTSESVWPLDQDGASGGRGLNPVDIGGVRGNLSLTDPVFTSGRLTGGTYHFTRATAGVAVPAPDPLPVTTQAFRDNRDEIAVVWWGQNDGTTDATQMIARLEDFRRSRKAYRKRMIFLGLSTGTEATRAAMDAQYEAYATQLGDPLYFLNIREYLADEDALLAEGITPTSGDLDDIATGKVPRSFYSNYPTDQVHHNAAGYRRIGRAVYERIKALGWNDQWGTLGDDSETAPALLFADTFDRPQGTSLFTTFTQYGQKSWVGSGTIPPGTFTVDGGAAALALGSGGGSEIFAIADAGQTDFHIEAVVKAVGSPPRAALAFNFSTFQNVTYIDGNPTAPHHYRLRNRVSNVTTDIDADLDVAPAPGDVIEVTRSGGTLTVVINGVTRYTGAAPSQTGTQVGFYALAASQAQRWDSITVREPS